MRGALSHPPLFCVARVALMTLGGALGLVLVARDAAALCVAGVAQCHIHLRVTWHAWRNVTSTFVLRGRRGTYGTGWRAWAGFSRLWRCGTLRGRRGAMSYSSSFHLAGVAHTYIYIHTYMHTCIHAYMHTCIHAYMHTCTHAYMHTCIHAYMHTCIHAYMHTCMHACMHAACCMLHAACCMLHAACMHTYIHTYIHAYIHTCMHAYIHTYIHTYIQTYVHTYILTTYVHTYVRTYIHTYIPLCLTQLFHHLLCLSFLPRPRYNLWCSLLEEVDLWGYPVL